MKDKAQELIWNLESELAKLDEAYVAGYEEITLANLGYEVYRMTSKEIMTEYKKVINRIFEIQSLLNVQNQN